MRSCQLSFVWIKSKFPTPWVVDIGHHFESFTVATTIWLTVMKYLCHKWPRIYFNGRKHLSFPLQNALVILLTEVVTMTKKNIWLITSHSSHHWIFCLARNMITVLVYIEYQNFTRIRIEEIILQVLILFAESNCL
jgi:hypothetical protein